MATKVGMVLTVKGSGFLAGKSRAIWREEFPRICAKCKKDIPANVPFLRDSGGWAICKSCQPWKEVKVGASGMLK
jgi:hypothetical protein